MLKILNKIIDEFARFCRGGIIIALRFWSHNNWPGKYAKGNFQWEVILIGAVQFVQIA